MKRKERDEIKNFIIQETENLTPQQIQQQIFDGAEALTPFQRKERDRQKEREIFHLLGGGLTSIKKIKDFRASVKQPYRHHFHQETQFYEFIYKLKDWPVEECKKFGKRREVALITLRLVYGRFSPEVINHIIKENPFIAFCIRKYKLFQFLNQEGQELLDIFIEEMVSMMIGYSDWDRFEFDYCLKHSLPYQSKLAL